METQIRKSMTLLYNLHNNLYVNLTNRCPCACVFCERQLRDHVSAEEDASLWLEREPEVQEVIAAFEQHNVEAYDEIVFCGFGEPTERLDAVLEIASYLKAHYNKPIRINTNGLANLIWGEDVTPKLAGLIDTVSISLNTPDAKRYQQIVRSKFGDGSFEAMLTFAKNAKQYVPRVVLSTVETTITKEEEQQCADLCRSLGVSYRIRPYED